MNAAIISPAVIAQTMSGTHRMRANVMRLGILKPDRPGRKRPQATGRAAEYNVDQAIARNAIST
jgi:hypothetical protein